MARLITAIITTLIYEAALVALWVWGLPLLGIHLHPGLLAGVMAGLALYSTIGYRIGTKALERKAICGLSDMVGSKGKVVERLKPEGMVRIGSELWKARSLEGVIDKGQAVSVVRQDGFKLFVHRNGKYSGATR